MPRAAMRFTASGPSCSLRGIDWRVGRGEASPTESPIARFETFIFLSNREKDLELGLTPAPAMVKAASPKRYSGLRGPRSS